ncbi:unnamed protein product [Protopolystoma xenopodis]|uniref:Uncharacterized protein n=1 Tax=Protopolystoma xenopodis TaxID=117903 RepID=A0A448XQS4_9PLAT|nr:unnamed protein product [Protopolystoma xenopodis]
MPQICTLTAPTWYISPLACRRDVEMCQVYAQETKHGAASASLHFGEDDCTPQPRLVSGRRRCKFIVPPPLPHSLTPTLTSLGWYDWPG